MKAYEEVYVAPFALPSPELFELLQQMQHRQRDMDELCAFEWSTDELRVFGEHDLTPQQIDRLLSR